MAKPEPAPKGLPWPTPGGRVWKVDGVPIPTAKSIVDLVVPRGGLGRWGARAAATYAGAHWTELSKLPTPDQVAAIAAAPFDNVSERGGGLRPHLGQLWAELSPTTPGPVPARAPAGLAEQARPQWQALVSWLNGHHLHALRWQATAWDPTPTRRYVAAVDLIARVDGSPPLLIAVELGETDHPEVRLRLAAARYAPQMLDPTGRGLADWPSIGGCAVMRIRPEGVTLTRTTAGPQERAAFRSALRLHRWVRQHTRSQG